MPTALPARSAFPALRPRRTRRSPRPERPLSGPSGRHSQRCLLEWLAMAARSKITVLPDSDRFAGLRRFLQRIDQAMSPDGKVEVRLERFPGCEGIREARIGLGDVTRRAG